MKSSNRLLLLCGLFAFSLAACGGGGGGSSSVGAVPSTGGGTTSTPTPTPVPSSAPGTTATPTPTPTTASAPIGNSSTAAIALYDPTDYVDNHIVGNAVLSSTSPNGPYVAIQPQAGGGILDGMACEPLATSYAVHVHLHVSLFVNGTQYAIPSAIGLINPVLYDNKYYWDDKANTPTSCDYPTKTHEPDGVIHLATNNTSEQFTLGGLFDAWNASISTSGPAQGFAASAFGSFSGQTRLFVTYENTGSPGSYKVSEIPSGTDPHTIVFPTTVGNDHLEYTIEVGPNFVNTPNYTFGPGLQ